MAGANTGDGTDKALRRTIPGVLGSLDALLRRHGLYLALVTAWAAMVGSLYFSEVRGFDPCVLCWYQRILLYPLCLIIPIGILRRDPKAHLYILPFALLDIPLSTYHHLLQRTHWFNETTVCRRGTPCSALYINWFGFIDIPTLALAAAIIIALATSAWARSRPRDLPPAGWRTWAATIGAIAGVLAFYAVVYLAEG